MDVQPIQSRLTQSFAAPTSIFRDRYVLHDSYDPDIILHRDKEITAIMSFFNNLRRGGRGHLDIHGSIGTGKTLITRKIAAEFINRDKAEKSKMGVVFLNCSEYGTQPQVLKKIAKEMAGKDKVGWGISIYMETIRRMLAEYERVIIVLDEVDKLMRKPKEREVFYNLTNLEKFSIISISNVTEWVKKYLDDARVASRRSKTESILFLPYTKDQILDILQYRTEHALNEGVCPKEVLQIIAEKAANSRGDMREALSLLDMAAEEAQRENLQQITKNMVLESGRRMHSDETINHILGQTLPKKLIMLIIFDHAKKTGEHPTADEIKRKYNKEIRNHPGLERLKLDTIRAYLAELCTYEYIEKTGGGGKGRGMGREPHQYRISIDEDRFEQEIYHQCLKATETQNLNNIKQTMLTATSL